MAARTMLKRIGRPIAAYGAYHGGYCRFVGRPASDRSARILGYHGINEAPDNPYAVSARDFRRQMAWLAKHYTPVSMESLVGGLQGKQPLPPRAVAVTIDDGYDDAYSHAYPVLQEFSIPATIFLPVAFIDEASNLRTRTDPKNAASRHSEKPRRLAQQRFLSWQQVREMDDPRSELVTFGSHTLTHVPLAQLSLDEMRHELETSRLRLEQELGHAVHGLAYPYGTVRSFNPLVQHTAAEAGYTWAVSGVSGLNDQGSDLLALKRTKVERWDSQAVFQMMLQGALDPWVTVDRAGRLLPTGSRTPRDQADVKHLSEASRP